jgi:iron complex transport system substrate-binding protein
MTRPAISVIHLLALTTWVGLACTSGEESRADPEGEAAAGEVRLVDAAGVELVLHGPARRVVSLVPSATETLRAMGAAGVLVGRTDFDTAPWVATLPSVGGGIEPNLEALVALEPDLVVRFAGEQDPRTPSRLDALGIEHLAVRPDRIADIYETARLLGEATGYAAAADSLVETIRGGLATVAASVRGLERVQVAYVLGGTPPWVAGPGTYIDEVVSLAGGENVFADLGALYSAVSPEELRTRDIQVVLLSAGAAYDRSLAPGARVEVVGDALEIPGPGVVDAAYHVAELLHGRSQP